MKWLKQAILVGIMLSTVFQNNPQSMLITSGYSNIFPEVKIVDKIYNSKNDYLQIDVIIPQIKGLANKEKEDNINNLIVKWTEDWINDVKSIADEYFANGTAPLNPYQVVSKYKVTSLEKIISFYIDYYQYTGGAHGITTRKAYNVDEVTGELLGIKDTFNEGYNYKDKINSKIRAEISKHPEYYFSGKEGFNGIDEKAKFYVEDGNLVIYYGNYEIAPYVTGIPEFRIPINMFEGNFKYGKI